LATTLANAQSDRRRPQKSLSRNGAVVPVFPRDVAEEVEFHFVYFDLAGLGSPCPDGLFVLPARATALWRSRPEWRPAPLPGHKKGRTADRDPLLCPACDLRPPFRVGGLAESQSLNPLRPVGESTHSITLATGTEVGTAQRSAAVTRGRSGPPGRSSPTPVARHVRAKAAVNRSRFFSSPVLFRAG
jgi:hypothetical protein